MMSRRMFAESSLLTEFAAIKTASFSPNRELLDYAVQRTDSCDRWSAWYHQHISLAIK